MFHYNSVSRVFTLASEEQRASGSLHGVRAMTKQARFGFTSASEERRESESLHGVRAMTKQARFGFTLIELLVVISIIGMLTSVVLTSLDSARLKGSTAAAQQTMKSIQIAAIICLGDNASIAPPTGTQDGGAGLLCTGNISRYVPLPNGWAYNPSSFSQVAGASFAIAAAHSGSGDSVSCDVNRCLKTP